ncbi:MAG TPA: PrsW family intramembrane metalloprotease, partial [Thermoplasmata archaeon]|nr:PrsW family intramembrane metalloprotease [Thermoplasmata archaeon]
MSKVFDILRIYALVLGALFILTGTFMGVIFITGGLDYPPWAVFAAMVILYAIGSTVIYGIVRPGGYYILVTHPGPYGWDARRPPARRVPGIGARGWEGGPWAGTRHPYGFPVHPPHPGTVHGRPGRASPRQRHTMPYQWRGRPGGGPYVTGVRPDAAGGRWDPWWATTTPHWEWHSRDEKIPLNRWDLPRPLTLLAIFVFSVILGTTLLVLGRGDPVMYLGFPAAFIIAFSFPSLIWISYVYEREYSLEPRRGMLIALAWGMLSTNIAIVLEMASGVNDLLLMAVVVAPVVEEAVKPMGLWFLRRSI